ncbi:MAG TPA: 2,3-diphosphoglycerate-dependent phosphoglycerate mutase [Candidatus Paceibacterota bacterium]|nr:2,3-diphosphoglycerate-dependent phosphoglycerate mutase [Candidatus Paceibacterota bacterium]
MDFKKETNTKTHTLVVLRHGESEWNKENKFTGWTDVDLSARGIEEAKRAGGLLKRGGYNFDIVYTSVLRRAIHTMEIVLAILGTEPMPQIHFAWQLNERHYGALQGLNKDEVKARYGEDQFKAWRRGFAAQPPPTTDEERQKELEAITARGAKLEKVPATESLADVLSRLLPYWQSDIAPRIQEGKSVLIVAHGNSLRALAKHLEHISNEGIADVEIPTGNPLVYTLGDDLSVLRKKYLE